MTSASVVLNKFYLLLTICGQDDDIYITYITFCESLASCTTLKITGTGSDLLWTVTFFTFFFVKYR